MRKGAVDVHKALGGLGLLGSLVLPVWAQPAPPAVPQIERQIIERVMTRGAGSYLGVALEEVTPERMGALGLKEERGAVIREVTASSPAETSGIQAQDVVIGFNGRPVDTAREFQRLIAETPSGRTVTLEILRQGQPQTLKATLGEREDRIGQVPSEGFEERFTEGFQKNFNKQFPEGFEFQMPGALPRSGRLGVRVEPLTKQLADYFGAKSGVLVAEVRTDSPAQQAGLKAGDVILLVDNQTIEDTQDLINALGQKESIKLQILRNRREQTMTAKLAKPLPKPTMGQSF